MFENGPLRERIRALVRERRFAGTAVAACERGDRQAAASAAATLEPPIPAPGTGGPGAGVAVGVEEYLPGGEWRGAHGAVFVHERLRSSVERRRPHWGRIGAPPERELDLAALARAGLERALFLDLETGGFATRPVFLAGTMQWNGSDFVLRQYFARHYGEEAALIEALSAAAAGFEFLITFNGKSYDAPFLHQRAVRHGVPLALPPRHVDVLHAARRRWREELRDCRLQTLERYVCRRHRQGDVPSDEVPARYHEFVRRGDPYPLIPVFHHNLLDVITMSEIVHALCRRAGDGAAVAPPPADGGGAAHVESLRESLTRF